MALHHCLRQRFIKVVVTFICILLVFELAFKYNYLSGTSHVEEAPVIDNSVLHNDRRHILYQNSVARDENLESLKAPSLANTASPVGSRSSGVDLDRRAGLRPPDVVPSFDRRQPPMINSANQIYHKDNFAQNNPIINVNSRLAPSYKDSYNISKNDMAPIVINGQQPVNNFGAVPGQVLYQQPNQYKQPEKIKQWEVYDYENPYNLLEIHVDRAPQHQEGMGLPWPMPQEYNSAHTYFMVDMTSFKITPPAESCGRLNRAIDRYAQLINSKVDLFIPEDEKYKEPTNVENKVIRSLDLSVTRGCASDDMPHEHMSEQYKLTVDETGAVLTASEVWGVIRGLETFSQLIYYRGGYAVINTTYIKDYPRFGFRGLMLDTARHFLPVKILKRTLDAMSQAKFNVFHWHIVDDQSFPYVSQIFPELSAKGAYSKLQTYSSLDIQRIIEYAADRGIRVIPEFDSPGHTRSWGLGYPELLTNCSSSYHPFGAVNPINNYTYDFMHSLWKEVHERFPDTIVHVGGDEINYKCWLKLKEIRQFMIKNNMTKDDYNYIRLDGDKLQGYYLKRLLEVMPKDRKKIAWEEAFNAAQMWNVSTDELIINVWKGGDYEWTYTVDNIIKKGYKVILSAPWYLNYISYGKDWTKYYEQDPYNFYMYNNYNSAGAQSYKDLILGGQVCLWAEFIDETNIESTLWPRANSPAEKLWSSSLNRDWKSAEIRFENHRCRMIRRGIKAMPNSGPGTCYGTMKIKPPFDANAIIK